MTDPRKIEKALALLPDLLAARERMLADLGRILHDSVAQDLSAVALICEHLAAAGGDHVEELNDVQMGAQRCVEELRSLSAAISPATDGKDFIALVRDFLHGLAAKTACKGTLLSDLRTLPMDHTVKLALYGCIRRTIGLGIRLGKATETRLIITALRSGWEMRLMDDAVETSAVEDAMQTEAPWLAACALLLDGEVDFPAGGNTRFALRREGP